MAVPTADRSDLVARAAVTRITQHAFGYWQSGVVFELLDSGLVDRLDTIRTDLELAQDCGLHPAGTAALLRAGQALGLLARKSDGWTLTPAARTALDRSSPTSLRHWFAVMARWREPWSQLHVALRHEEGAGGGSAALEDDAGYVRDFILGMHEFARLSADAVVAAASEAFPEPVSSGSLLDVGGGAGTYAIAALRRAPAATATVLDHPHVVPITREIAEAEGVADRVHAVAGDYCGRYGDGGHRTVLLSNVLHQEDDEAAVAMLVESRRVAAPDGHVVVHTHLIDDDRPAAFPALQGVSAFVLWSGGAGMPATRLRALVERAHLTLERTATVRESGTTLAVCR